MTLFGFTTVFLIASIFIKIEAFPAFPCSSSSDSGYYADPTDCRYFYQCSWGNAAHFKCPANLYYNPSSQVCDYPENVACGAKPADSTTTTASPISPKGIFVCPPDAGPFDHYSDPTDCGHFYQCVAGNAYRMPCPAGLHFNVAIQRCDYPENVHCVISPITTASPNACKDLQFTATADNELWIYADGQQIGYHFNWPTTTTVTIPETTKVIAAKINDYDNVVGGFLGSFSDGSVTDSSWKCTRNYSDEWKLSTFDDSAWPAAVATRGQGDRTWGTQPQIANNAKWIWAGSYETVNPTVTVYCRRRLACA